MQVNYRVNENAAFNLECKDILTAFQFLAYCDSIFKVSNCGNCEGPNLRLVHRTPQGYDFYSVQCTDCKHELKFGQTKEGHRLYPKGWEEPYQGGAAKSDDSGGEEQAETKKTKPADDIPF